MKQVAELAYKLGDGFGTGKSARAEPVWGMAMLFRRHVWLASGAETVPECLVTSLSADDDVGAADAVQQAWLNERNLCQQYRPLTGERLSEKPALLEERDHLLSISRSRQSLHLVADDGRTTGTDSIRVACLLLWRRPSGYWCLPAPGPCTSWGCCGR